MYEPDKKGLNQVMLMVVGVAFIWVALMTLAFYALLKGFLWLISNI